MENHGLLRKISESLANSCVGHAVTLEKSFWIPLNFLSVLLITRETAEKITGLTSLACAALQLSGKFFCSSNFFTRY